MEWGKKQRLRNTGRRGQEHGQRKGRRARDEEEKRGRGKGEKR